MCSFEHMSAEALSCGDRRLEQLQKQFRRGEMEQVAWLDGLTWKEIEKLRAQVVPVPTINARSWQIQESCGIPASLCASIPLSAWSIMELGVRQAPVPHRADML